MDQVQNFIKEPVDGLFDADDLVIDVIDASDFPDPASGQYNLVWWDNVNYPDPSDDPNVEIVRVTARDTVGNTLTVTRAQEDTSASTKNTVGGTYFMALCPTKKTIADLSFKSFSGAEYKINNPYCDGGSLALKGQLHCHSNNSDGIDTPSAVVTAYKNAGYDFITITDHDYITADPSVAGITWLGASVEETVNRHTIAYDIATQSTDLNVQDVINFHQANGKLTSIAHPVWSGSYVMDESELSRLYGFNFIEVFNKTVNGYGDSQFDYALSSGKKVFTTAVDDCHNVGGADFNKGWVVVNVDTNSAAAILASLRNGNFYASTGNDIAISVAGNVVTASSVGSSNFIFYGRDGRILKTENGVTSSAYTILGDEMYVRVKSTKVSDSTIAWSQPVFIDILSGDSEKLAKIRLLTPNHSMARQALMNGNFDIWQRGESVVLADSTVTFLADRWRDIVNKDGGTLPTITRSLQAFTPGELDGSYYFSRLNTNGAGSSLGVNSLGFYRESIENGTRFLCGNGKKVTVSFWARSSIANKRITPVLIQYYGTGGSPTAQEPIKGTPITLTSVLTKYTVTFTTNTLVGKTFGTNNDDALKLDLYYMWGTTWGDTYVQSGVTAETFVGSGNIDIAKVQLCSGAVDLPFQPKSREEELRACQRYCYGIKTNLSGAVSILALGFGTTTTNVQVLLNLPVVMRAIPTLVATATDWQVSDGPANVDATSIAISASSENTIAALNVGVASGITVNRPYRFQGDGTVGRVLILSAEL